MTEFLVPAVLTLFLFLFGACVGSFLNVVIYRLPRGESIAHPPSHCPRCGYAIRAIDNIPLISWLALKGRCRMCATPISPRYFTVEMLTGLLFVAAGWAQGRVWLIPNYGFNFTSDLLHALLIIGLLVPITFIDLDHKIVPDQLSAPLVVVGLVWNVVDAFQGRAWLVTLLSNNMSPRLQISLPTSMVFAAIGAGIFWVIQWAGEIIFKKEAMGLGDAAIAAGIGANFPILASLCSFAIAIMVGAIAGVLLMSIRRVDLSHRMAFGPMLAIGALIMLLLPDQVYGLVDWYRSTLHP